MQNPTERVRTTPARYGNIRTCCAGARWARRCNRGSRGRCGASGTDHPGRAQWAGKITLGMCKLAIDRLEVGDAVLVAEDLIDLEGPDVIGNLGRVDERVVV